MMIISIRCWTSGETSSYEYGALGWRIIFRGRLRTTIGVAPGLGIDIYVWNISLASEIDVNMQIAATVSHPAEGGMSPAPFRPLSS